MRKIFSILYILLLPFSLCAQGIVFQDLSYGDALKRAKEQNKLVFLDCYTSWCGPCKVLAKEIFTLAEAGDFFNPDYIPIKIDMEKGEGPELVKSLSIKSYPTMIVADGDGNIITKISGSMPIAMIKERIVKSLDSPMYKFHNRYKNGEMTSVETIQYITLLGNSGERDKAAAVAKELIEKTAIKDRFNDNFWKIYSNSRISYRGTDNFEFICENKKKFEKAVGKSVVDRYLYDNFFRGMVVYIYGNMSGVRDIESIEYMNELKKKVKKLNIKGEEDIIAHIDLAIARHNNNSVKMAECLEKIIHKITDKELWGYATSFFKVRDADPKCFDYPEVKRIGQKFTDIASEENKRHYSSLFKIY